VTYALVAQGIEQRFPKPLVGCSSHPEGTFHILTSQRARRGQVIPGADVKPTHHLWKITLLTALLSGLGAWASWGSDAPSSPTTTTVGPPLDRRSDDPAPQIYVTDSGNNRIVRIDDMAGSGWTVFGTFSSGAYEFTFPKGIFVR
jgi:hypothetical protein